MKSVELKNTVVNAETLNEEIRQTVGEVFVGLSTNLKNLTLHFSEDATNQQMQVARNLVMSHDPQVLSTNQQKAQQRTQALSNARERYVNELDVNRFAGKDADTQELAERVLWLEQEIRDLRGL